MHFFFPQYCKILKGLSDTGVRQGQVSPPVCLPVFALRCTLVTEELSSVLINRPVKGDQTLMQRRKLEWGRPHLADERGKPILALLLFLRAGIGWRL